MSSQSRAVLEAAMSLSADERAELADELWASLDAEHQAHVDAAWNREFEKRVDELDNGRVAAIPLDEALRQLHERKGQ